MLCELALVLLRTQAWNALLSAGGQRLVLRAQAWNAHLWLRRLREVFAELIDAAPTSKMPCSPNLKKATASIAERAGMDALPSPVDALVVGFLNSDWESQEALSSGDV